ncbi:MAG TPA: hypothetical protein VGU24_04710 [Microvirga sp.]|jgi:predicted MFS family arabinose efflux permease|nr:hypothetical protein [Microvirga sp.]
MKREQAVGLIVGGFGAALILFVLEGALVSIFWRWRYIMPIIEGRWLIATSAAVGLYGVYKYLVAANSN